MSDPIQAASAAASTASKATYGGGFAALVASATSNEFAAIAGVAIGFAGFGVQWYYRRMEFRLRLREHERRMAGRMAPTGAGELDE